MASVPLDPARYRLWWHEQRPDIPYGLCWCGCGLRTTVSSRGYKKKGMIKGEPMRYVSGHRDPEPFTPSPEYRSWWESSTTVPFGYCWCGCGQQTRRARFRDPAKGWVKGEPVRFLQGHGTRTGISSPDTGYIIENRGHGTPCWIWQRGRGHAYGKYWDGTRHVAAHRFFYERDVGPIPAGLQIDHLCRQTLCCNPEHLEPVTPAENVRRARAAR